MKLNQAGKPAFFLVITRCTNPWGIRPEQTFWLGKELTFAPRFHNSGNLLRVAHPYRPANRLRTSSPSEP